MPALTMGLGACAAEGSGDTGATPTTQSVDAADLDKTGVSPDAGAEPESGRDPDAKLDLPSDELPKLAPSLRDPRPTCPTVTWCAPQAAAVKVAADDTRSAEGCPVSVTTEARPTAKEDGGPRRGELATNPVYTELFLGGRGGPVTLDAAATAASRQTGSTDACCYSWTQPCPGGRPFMDAQQQPVLATSRPGAGWSAGAFELQGSPEARREAAASWLADAAMEHAAVASFGRVALELMALGAPAELVAATHRAALDEVRHAQTCMAIARACGADELEPGPMAITGPRAPDFARFAADTFIEGCVGESTAALAAQRAARGCASPELRAALEQISAEEAEHAALAWRSVAWALRHEPARVRAALAERAAAFGASIEGEGASRENSPAVEGLAELGRLDPQRLAATRADAWFGVVLPMLRELGVRAEA